jgi:hypothetical protein
MTVSSNTFQAIDMSNFTKNKYESQAVRKKWKMKRRENKKYSPYCVCGGANHDILCPRSGLKNNERKFLRLNKRHKSKQKPVM